MGKEILTALSPWSEVDASEIVGLSPRLDTLKGKTIGMFGDFMNSATYMLNGVELELRKRWGDEISFSYIQYAKDPQQISLDEEFNPIFLDWASKVDCIIAFYGAVPSSSLFLGYNCAYMEKLGKPTVLAVVPRTYSAGVRGCRAIGVPSLRILSVPAVTDIHGHAAPEDVIRSMDPIIEKLTDDITDALTRPLTEEETNPSPLDQSLAIDTISGTAKDISSLFYHYGWTNGQPIEIPTREAVDEMLRGTDLPADYVVAKIPPKMGCATVEKIAVNAVMAGCLPTYLPILIAAVKGAVLDPRVHLEGWTCSQSTWGPVLTLSGQIVKDINYNAGSNHLSPYVKPNATIGRAFGYIMMNIGGLRPNIEDLSEAGHEFRLGFSMADNPDENPWGPVHEDFGLDRNDSAVTMFWPQEHRTVMAHSVTDFLRGFCKLTHYGWDPGLCIIMTPQLAEAFAKEGWTKKRILKYIVEYDRVMASDLDLKWLRGNAHPPKTVDLPESLDLSTRAFWSDEHMFALVAGGHAGMMATVFLGGGDHGGPSCTKIDLPKNWDALVAEYSDVVPDYISY